MKKYLLNAYRENNRSKFILVPSEDGSIKFEGDFIDNGSESAGVLVGNMMLPVTEINSTAQFRISPYQFEQIKHGIAKVRLSTIPIEHERIFKKDKIGKKLYKFYQNARSKPDDF